ncbi:MAG: alpha-amylase family glycosyl hydrolase [Alsobacter sp.]
MDAGSHPWWQDAVFYEIYVRSFQDSDGDGVGDLRGILQRIPYLVELGVDAVWLTPFYPSPMADFGYDVADYCGVDPLFGSLDDFDALLAALRRAGIRTVVDFVPNHTSDQHPWFVDSRRSRTSPRRDWYVWRDPSPAGGPPNNWLSQSGGPAWTFDPATGQYYLHSFLPEQPDLNWGHPGVRAAMLDVLRFWLSRNVDGFRVDVLTGLSKDPLARDDPPNPRHREGDPDFMRLEQVNSANGPALLDHVAAMRSVLSEFGPDRVLIGEVYRPVETLVAFYGEGERSVHLPFNFNLMWLRWVPEGILGLVRTYEEALPPGAWPTWVLGNHDHPRVASRLGRAQARIAMMLLLTLRGTPTLYQGDELAMEDVPVPPGQGRDRFAAAGPGRGRDPQRAPMPWDDAPGRGFSRGRPWLPLPPPGQPASAGAQAREATSMLRLTQALLRLRRAEAVLRRGAWRALSASGPVLAYERVLGDRICRVVLNLGQAPVSVDLGFAGAQLAVSTHARPRGTLHRAGLDLDADEGVVMLGEAGSGREQSP